MMEESSRNDGGIMEKSSRNDGEIFEIFEKSLRNHGVKIAKSRFETG